MGDNSLQIKSIAEKLQILLTNISQREAGHVMQSQIFRYAGYKGLEKIYEEHSAREWKFTKQIIYRILYLGETVRNEEKKATEVFEDPVKCMKNDLEIAKKELNWIRELAELFINNDLTSYEVLLQYYMYQEKIVHWLEKQLEYINDIGIKNYLTYRIDVNDNPSFATF